MNERHSYACPACEGALATVAYEGVRVLACPLCEGVFVGTARLNAIRERRFRTWTVRQQREAARLAAHGRETPVRACPLCRQEMQRVAVRSGGQVVVADFCGKCGAYWFDRGELDMIQILAEGREDAFQTPAAGGSAPARRPRRTSRDRSRAAVAAPRRADGAAVRPASTTADPTASRAEAAARRAVNSLRALEGTPDDPGDTRVASAILLLLFFVAAAALVYVLVWGL